MIRIVWICRLMLFVACLGVFDARSAETNFLAFHLLAETVSIDGIGDGTALPENLKLDPTLNMFSVNFETLINDTSHMGHVSE